MHSSPNKPLSQFENSDSATQSFATSPPQTPRPCRRLVLAGIAVCLQALCAAPLAAGAPLPLAQPEEVGMSSERLARIGALMHEYVDTNQLAGTVTLVARHGKVVHFEAVGYRYAEEKQPMTTDAVFRIASMTKPIASVALMMLYEEGRFSLDDPVSKCLPEYADMQVAVKAPDDERIAQPYKLVPATRPITVRQLLTHTAGLANTYRGLTRNLYQETFGSRSSRSTTASEFSLRLAKLPLNFQPGAAWEYSRATDIVGVLVEKMSGQTLDAFLRERIFEPLGMQDTHFNIPQEKIDRLAALYRPDDDGKIELTRAPAYREPTTYFSGAGGLASTAADYFRFQQMMVNGGELDGARILGRKTVELIITNHIGDHKVWLKGPGYGFGLGYSVLLDAGKANEPLSPGSFGWGGAYCTYFFVDPVEGLIGVLMTQIRPYTHLDVRRQLCVLANQAIIDRPEQGPAVRGHVPIR